MTPTQGPLQIAESARTRELECASGNQSEFSVHFYVAHVLVQKAKASSRPRRFAPMWGFETCGVTGTRASKAVIFRAPKANRAFRNPGARCIATIV